MNGFKSVKDCVSIEYIEKKSRFIAHVKPVSTEEEAVGFINLIKARYHDARHNVYAYCIGISDGISNISQRYSDDGEPQGTAGIPILEVIKKNGLTNVVIVVTRYFGGILLGAPGLVRAYSKSASDGVTSACTVEYVLCDVANVEISYTLLGLVQKTLESPACSDKYFIDKIEYGEKVVLTVLAARGDSSTLNNLDAFERLVIETTNSLCKVERCRETRWWNIK